MQIIRYAFNLPPKLGGMENHVEKISIIQSKEYLIKLFYMNGKQFTKSNIYYIRNPFNFKFLPYTLQKFIHSIIFSFYLILNYNARKYTIIHMHGDFVDTLIPSKIGKFIGFTITLSIHGSSGKFIPKYINHISFIAYRSLSFIFPLSIFITRYLIYLGIPPNKIKTISSGFDTKKYDPQFFNSNCKKLKTKLTKIHFIGRLIPLKRPELVIQAYLSFIEKFKTELNQQTQLIMVGDGPMMQYLKKYKRKDILFKGQLSKEKTMCELKSSSLIILPSIFGKYSSEATPTIGIESIMLNVPFLTTKIHGLVHYKKIFNNIFWLDIVTVAEVTTMMKTILIDTVKITKNDPAISKSLFSWESISNKYIETFHNLLKLY